MQASGGLAGSRRRELAKRCAAPVIVMLMVGLGMVSTGLVVMHDLCEAADLGITLIGEVSEEVQEFDLAINSTAGGSVSTPGEGSFAYAEGAVVSLKAAAEDDYRFVRWTGHVGTMADVYEAETTITVDGHYSITAEFAGQPVENTLRPPLSAQSLWAVVVAVLGVLAGAVVVVFFVRRRRSA